jgi:putative transposase
MANYRRNRVADGTYFFTVNLADRDSHLLVDHIDMLRAAVREVRHRRPFHIDAWVVLPEHMHAVWTLPGGDDDYSGRWLAIKKAFSKALPRTESATDARIHQGERGIWQRRFWEHTIRDEADYAAHINYVHFNPLKHGWVQHVAEWPYSTFHRAVKQGIYSEDWIGVEDDGIAAGER